MSTTSCKARQRRRLTITKWTGGVIAGAMVLTFLAPALFSVGA